MSLIDQLREGRLIAYRAAPGDIQEHFGIEETVLAGGYGYRQVMELVQNGADAILEHQQENGGQRDEQARITVALIDKWLYVANTGAPLSTDGAKALLQSHSSPKRGNQIGRFGIGFKSLLRLGGRIDLISRSMSMRFDPDKAREMIRREFSLPDDVPVPALRIAWDLDGDAEREADPVLGEFRWATTIVRAEIRNEMMLSHIREEMEKFPGAFLLFLPVAVRLVMDFREGEPRCLERLPDGENSVLLDGEESSRWRVIERPVHVTDPAAISDATHLHARDKVPIAWAVPLEAKREEAGRFWAFFPTETPTRMPGIVNAPWKLNSDRKALIDGEWNRLLMREIAGMISEELPKISAPDDPAKPLDAFPRRLERQDELAATLVGELWKMLADTAIVPDANGTLRFGRELNRPPIDDFELAEEWMDLAGTDARKLLVHPSSLSGNRKGRLEELAQHIAELGEERDEHPCLGRLSAAAWLHKIATTDTANALKVLAVTESYADKIQQQQWRQERGEFEIILAECGKLCRVDSSVIAPNGTVTPNQLPVHSKLLEDEAGLRILTDVLGIGRLDDGKWRELLQQTLAATSTKYQPVVPAACFKLWELLRASPVEVRDSFLQKHSDVMPLKRRDGEWRHRGAVLSPGRVVAAEDEVNQGVLFDAVFHKSDADLLKFIGVSEFPTGQFGPDEFQKVAGPDKNLLSEWLDKIRDDFRSGITDGPKPQAGCLNPEPLALPFGWILPRLLSGRANGRATEFLLDVAMDRPDMLLPVEFGHDTRKDTYPSIQVAHPFRWMLCNYGSLELFSEVVPVKAILKRIDNPVLERLPGWIKIKSKLSRIIEKIEVECGSEEIEQFWSAMAKGLVSVDTLDQPWLRELWDGMAADHLVPSSLPSASGSVPVTEAHYTTSRDLARHARSAGLVVAEVSVETGKVWKSMGAKGLDDLFVLEWDEGTERDTLLVQAVPEVFDVLKEGAAEAALCRTVSGLNIRFGEKAGGVACVMWDGVLHQDLDKLQSITRSERLRQILTEIENAGWLKTTAKDALELIADTQVDTLRTKVAAGGDLPERLLRAVGGRLLELRQAIGESACRALGEVSSGRQLSELTMALLGPLVLQRLVGCLREEGLKPPYRWGTAEARNFVSQLGFPEAFAAAAESKRDPELIVSGPIQLPPLHDFQEEVVDGLRSLVQSGDGRRRAVVSLPTGGGKTRATVQAAVELILVPPSKRRSVLWIAQTDELCEQAVQAFRQVWANVGQESTNLRIVRLWGGHRSPVRSDDGLPVAVIASIQTLNSRVGQEELAWLSEPGLVVIDECHHAIAKSYTGVLRWLDAESPRAGGFSGKEPPVIGLSATPFRNSCDDDESLRLAKRFDQRWLPGNQEHLYRDLLNRGILAQAEHEELKTDAPISEELLQGLDGLEADSIQIENILERINHQLANNQARNDLLVETIATSEASSILCFANSVSHSEELAARLCVMGIKAAAISGETPRAARRYFLAMFQTGEIRVLFNYAVLSTGFDAPKTDMLLISRQIMSPVRYMQMVGRGLRGIANGGTERCRIVTVMDNLGRFEARHPFHYCARFFSEQ